METSQITSVPVVTKGSQGSAAPLRTKSAAATPLSQPQQITKADIDRVAQADAKRLERVRNVANTFIVSDQTFSIYKDTAGQFITRFTSLRDGKVTYVPEPSLLSRLESQQSIDPSLSFSV